MNTDTADLEAAERHETEHGETPAEALNAEVTAQVQTRSERHRYRPTTAEGDALKAENADLRLSVVVLKGELSDVLGRTWKWQVLIGLLGLMVGGLLGRAIQ